MIADPILSAFEHFFHMDKANAAIHLGQVRFSPITLALLDHLDYADTDELHEARSHVGAYELDHGR